MRRYLRDLLRIRVPLDDVRRASPRVLVYAMVANLGLLLFAWGIFYANDLQAPVYRATRGLVGGTLQMSLIDTAVFALILFAGARLRPRDLGLGARDLPLGIALTAGFWIAMQLGTAAWVALRPPPPVLGAEPWATNPAWSEYPLPYLGALLGQLFGNALVEEAIFRGLLVPQLYLLARGRWDRRRALIAAVLLSQALFAGGHLFVNLVWGAEGLTLLAIQAGHFISGVGLVMLWLLTGNLFVAIGVHALMNTPTTILDVPRNVGSAIVCALALGLVLAWPLVERRRR